MRHLLLTTVATVLLTGPYLFGGQGRRSELNNAAQQTILDIQERPEMGVAYSRTAALKLASRKRSYRFGEVVSLDLAMLNTGNKHAYFHKLSGPTISLEAFDKTGAEVGITPNVIALEGVVPGSYSLLNPGRILIGSIQMLIGCKVEGASAFDEARRKLDEDVRQKLALYDEAIFERDLFVNWGEACLRTDEPGSYDLVVKVSNSHVILAGRQIASKTAVGIIRSNKLSLTISE